MYKDYVSFIVNGSEVILISDEVNGILNTIAEIDNNMHYMGAEQPSIATAICAWQDYNVRDLSDAELHQVMVDNKLI